MGLFTLSEKQIKHYDKWVAELPMLDGKVIAITGTTSGTGSWFVKCAIKKNARSIIMINRHSERVTKSCEEFEKYKTDAGTSTELINVGCDLQDFESVKKAAEEINTLCEERDGLDVLANNAGVMALGDIRTKDGYDIQMQTNHLSHYLLTKSIFSSFQKALENGKEVRICQHSSVARFGGPLKERNFRKCDPGTLGGGGLASKFGRYHQTKLANSTFAMKLHKELVKNGFDVSKIKSVVAEPGVSTTALVDNSNFGFFSGKIITMITKYRKYQHGADGTLPLIEACFGKSVASGDFLHPKDKTVGIPVKAMSQAKDEATEKQTSLTANQDLVWKVSEEELGKFFP